MRPSPDISSLLTSASAGAPDAPALVHGETTMTFRELAAAADRLAATLGVAPGERVVVVAPNVPALVVGVFAAWRAGAVAVPLSARLRRFELERAFANAEPAIVVSTAAQPGFALAEEIAAIANRVPTLRACMVLDDLGGVVHESRQPAPRPSAPSAPELAAIMYTSGSTGEPKGGLASHAFAAAMARNLADLLGDDASAPYCLVVPASHAFGLGCLLCGVAAGATAVMVDATASLEPLTRALQRSSARVLHGSPALFARLLRAGTAPGVQSGFVAGSLCSPEVLRTLEERGARILNVFGMTEIGAATSCRQDDPPQTRYHTVGRPLPGYEVRVVATESLGDAFTEPDAGLPGNADLPGNAGLLGEIQVRSGYLPTGYHGRPWSEAEVADGQWFRTGDLGELDAAGNLIIAGRAKELIHVGGFNVFPADVESFLLTHPAIEQAVVIGAPHPVLGEAAQAFVVPAAGSALEPREVVRFARSGIAGYKVPYSVRILDALPLLASGKPDRRALAQLARPRAGVADGLERVTN